MGSYPVKDNPIGSAVSENLWYKQTDKHTPCYFITRIVQIMEEFTQKQTFNLIKELLSFLAKTIAKVKLVLHSWLNFSANNNFIFSMT